MSELHLFKPHTREQEQSPDPATISYEQLVIGGLAQQLAPKEVPSNIVLGYN